MNPIISTLALQLSILSSVNTITAAPDDLHDAIRALRSGSRPAAALRSLSTNISEITSQAPGDVNQELSQLIQRLPPLIGTGQQGEVDIRIGTQTFAGAIDQTLIWHRSRTGPLYGSLDFQNAAQATAHGVPYQYVRFIQISTFSAIQVPVQNLQRDPNGDSLENLKELRLRLRDIKTLDPVLALHVINGHTKALERAAQHQAAQSAEFLEQRQALYSLKNQAIQTLVDRHVLRYAGIDAGRSGHQHLLVGRSAVGVKGFHATLQRPPAEPEVAVTPPGSTAAANIIARHFNLKSAIEVLDPLVPHGVDRPWQQIRVTPNQYL